MLDQKSRHLSSANNCYFCLFKIWMLCLRELDSSTADTYRSSAYFCLCPYSFTSYNCSFKKLTYNLTSATMSLSFLISIFNLRQNLTFSKDKRLKPTRSPHQMVDALLIGIHKQMLFKLLCCEFAIFLKLLCQLTYCFINLRGNNIYFHSVACVQDGYFFDQRGFSEILRYPFHHLIGHRKLLSDLD